MDRDQQTTLDYDHHVHSRYSDGARLLHMARAAEDAGLSGVGFADHCVVTEREKMREIRRLYGGSLDLTYDRRRRGIETLRERLDIDVYDTAEIDYHPTDEAVIESFLDDARFEYTVGSIHLIEGRYVNDPGAFDSLGAEGKRKVVETYVDRLVALARAEVFEVVAHPDLLGRNPALSEHVTDGDRERVTTAFADSRTIPEMNAKGILAFDGLPPLLDEVLARGVAVSLGSDTHDPWSFEERLSALGRVVSDHGIDPVRPISAPS